MVGGANFHPGCGRSAPTCTPPPHAHACAQSCKFCAACWRSSQSDRISDDCYTCSTATQRRLRARRGSRGAMSNFGFGEIHALSDLLRPDDDDEPAPRPTLTPGSIGPVVPKAPSEKEKPKDPKPKK